MTLLCMLLEILPEFIRYDTEDSKETIRQSMDVYWCRISQQFTYDEYQMVSNHCSRWLALFYDS
jgi:hypothetical protein